MFIFVKIKRNTKMIRTFLMSFSNPSTQEQLDLEHFFLKTLKVQDFPRKKTRFYLRRGGGGNEKAKISLKKCLKISSKRKRHNNK